MGNSHKKTSKPEFTHFEDDSNNNYAARNNTNDNTVKKSSTHEDHHKKKESKKETKTKKTLEYEIADVFRLDDSRALLDQLWDNTRDIQQFSLSQFANLRKFKSSDQIVSALTTVVNTIETQRASFQKTLVGLQVLHQQNKALFFVPDLWNTGTQILQKVVGISNDLQSKLNRLLQIDATIASELYSVESGIMSVWSNWPPIEAMLSEYKKTIVECLRWCPPQATFRELASAVNNPSFSDLVLLSKNGSSIHVHKVMLKYRAPALTQYLEQLQGVNIFNWIDRKDKPLKDISSIYIDLYENVIMVLLKFIYAGIVDQKDASVISEIEDIATEFPQIQELQTLLELKDKGIDQSVSSDLLQALEIDHPEFCGKRKKFTLTLEDVTLVAEHKEVKAHKVILCFRCQYFQGLLNSGMQESQQDKINIQDMTHSQLEQVIQFIYSDTLPITDPNDSVDLLMLADRFFLNDLKKLCEVCVRVCLEGDDIPVDQILNAYQVAKYHTAEELKEWLLANSIAKNIEKIVNSPHYQELDEECKVEINIWRQQ